MLKSIIILVFGLFIITPNLSLAIYYAQDYDPEYLPYNFQDAVDAGYSECTTVLDQYDSGYWKLDEKFEALNKGVTYTGPAWVSLGSQPAFNLEQLRDFTEEEIRLCIINYRDYQNEQEELAKEIAEKAANAKAAAERQSAIKKAVDDCDFEFFESMTNSEKMDTYRGREACKTDSTSTSVPDTAPTQTPVTSPIVENIPIYTPPVTTTHIASANTQPQETIRDIEEISASASETATTKPEVTTPVIQEQASKDEPASETPETESEPKPSVFKRVFSFLFGWIW